MGWIREVVDMRSPPHEGDDTRDTDVVARRCADDRLSAGKVGEGQGMRAGPYAMESVSERGGA